MNRLAASLFASAVLVAPGVRAQGDPAKAEPSAGATAQGEASSATPAEGAPEPLEAEPPPAPAPDLGDQDFELETTLVTAQKITLDRTPGSAQTLSEQDLEAFEYDDPHQVLSTVPGVYLRGEDGFGLRPNIGIRGASSDRSKKITLMEDGVLLAPAPYSAPAAYYFPLVTRMQSVRVIKGPSSIRYGPHTVGGAVDLVTAPVPSDQTGLIDAMGGSYVSGRAHARFGASGDRVGYLIEGVHLRSSGFKDLDGGGDTGFYRNEWMMKAQVTSDPAQHTFHTLQLKLGYSDEASDETYLGLTDADFDATPYRRYAASRNDRMEWWRSQLQLSYKLELGRDVDVTTTAYRHDFTRSWRKFNEFAGGESVFQVLADPTSFTNRPFYDVLTGQGDSADAANILLGTNRRVFVAQGIQSLARVRVDGGALDQAIEFGARFHYDEVDRLHTEDQSSMTAGELVSAGLPTSVTANELGSANAVALHLVDEISIGRLLVAPAIRAEFIWTSLRDRLANLENDQFQLAILPGIGAFYSLTDEFGVLAGVHRGFSPVPPSGSGDPDPEFSIAYEAGARYATKRTRAELIGFLSDYSNLTDICTVSSGCQAQNLDDSFTGGEVLVYGAEASAELRLAIGSGLDVPVEGSYTFTDSSFRSSFTSENPVWGQVAIGDNLPYVPMHQASLVLGVASERWGVNAIGNYVGEMRDVAGQGTIPQNELIEAHAVFDLSANVVPFLHTKLYLKVDNVADTAYPIARRPFGLRPGKPRFIQVGLEYAF